MLQRAFRLASRQWQRNHELTSQSRTCATRHYMAAVRVDQFAYHRESDAQAGAVEADGMFVLHEGLEDAGQEFGRDVTA